MILAQHGYSALNRHLTINSEGCSSNYSRESNLADEQNYNDTIEDKFSNVEEIKMTNKNVFKIDKLIHNHEIPFNDSGEQMKLDTTINRKPYKG